MSQGFVASNPFFHNVWQEGLQRGLKPYQIAGLIGNFYGESKGNTSAIGDGGKAIGAAQWNDRAPMLKAFAAQRGTDWRDPATQAKFVFHEGDTTERKAFEKLKASKNVQEAVNAGIGYERPAGFNNPSSWASHPTLHYDTRLKGAQMAVGDVSPTAFAANSKLGYQPQDTTPASQSQPQIDPSTVSKEETPTSGWDTAGKIGNGLMGAGAALMAIDNPNGASTIMSGIRANNRAKKSPWQHIGQTPDGTAIIQQDEDGNVRTLPLPGVAPKNNLQYRGIDTDKDGNSFDTFVNPNGEIVRKPTTMQDPAFKQDEGPALNAEGLDTATELYARSGGKLGTTGLSKKAKEEVTNNLGKWAKDHNTDVGQIFANGPKYAGYMAQERDMGQRYNRMSTAKTEMDATLATLEKSVEKLPKDLVNGTVPWNAFMQGTSTYWNDKKRPELAAYRETIQNAANAYATLLARGATNVPVAMQNRANELFNTYMDPNTVKGVTGVMRDTSDRMMQGMKYSQDNLRDEIAGKTPRHVNVEQDIEAYIEERHKSRQPASATPEAPKAVTEQKASPQGMPSGSRQDANGDWWAPQSNGRWRKVIIQK